MNAEDLIGSVGQRLIGQALEQAIGRGGGETARFVLDILTPLQVGAIVKAILANPTLSSRLFIRIKNAIARHTDIPAELHTTETEVWFRNHEPPNGEPALLIATDGDDQRESLEELVRFTVADLKSAAGLWVEFAARGLPIGQDQQQLQIWTAALDGLSAARDVSLQAFAEYVSVTRRAHADEGESLIAALGQALPTLRLPRDSDAFESLKDTQRTWRSSWRRRFDVLFTDRASLLTKHHKSGASIEHDDLERQYQQLVSDGHITEATRPVFETFIVSPANWNAESAALAQLEWETDHVSDFFSGLRTKQDQNLGIATRDHFVDHGIELTKDDSDYLKVLESKKSIKQSDDPADRDFYDRHTTDIARDPKLKAKWDSFIFGAAVTCTDLLEGIIGAIERLRNRADWNVGKKLEIKVHGRGDKYFRELNADLATLFSLRYRGLKDLFGERVTLDLGQLEDFERFLEEQYNKGHKKRNKSSAKSATSIRFDVRLVTDIGVDHLLQILWTGSPLAVATNLADDLERLQEDPFIRSSVERNRVSRKGEAQRLSLKDYSSFEPAYGQDAGTLVPRLDGQERWAVDWGKAVKAASTRGAITDIHGRRLTEFFDAFATSYKQAIKKLREGKLGDGSLLEQADAYADLLAALEPVLSADMDVPRRELVHPLLEIGVVRVPDRTSAAVVAPWNPLRLAAIACKARRVAAFVNHVLENSSIDFGDHALFFRDFREQLQHPHYPEVVVGYHGDSPQLLVVTDTVDEYSLAEHPRPQESEWFSDSDPGQAANRVQDIVRRYLELQPHEKANMSVALYNCESAGLPTATVEALAALQEDEVHCHVVLRHSDPTTLRRVYSELLEYADSDPDALIASETSRNFMANLRVGIQLEAPVTPSPRDTRSADIAFLDDVVSRRAQLSFPEAPNTTALPAVTEHIPGQWSYRVPVGAEQTSAMRFLVCPEQPRCGLEYLRATIAVVDPQPGRASYRLPARRLAFSDARTSALLREVHDLAEWVVNYDDLLEPEQLRNLGISVIRYRRDATQGRNLIVSSTSQSGMLLALVQRRLNELDLGVAQADVRQLAEKLVQDAVNVSGEIALRATKRGVFAGELIGVVLSRALVKEELGSTEAQAWYFLDDFATWLGQREGGIADLIALSPIRIADDIGLRVRVTEAKYVSEPSLPELRKKSRDQLKQTVERIRDALFGNPGRLDRDLWLSRLGELLVQASHRGPAMREFGELQRRMRTGEAQIDLRGYSHVFVTGPVGSGHQSSVEPLPEGCGSHAIQEVFNRSDLRELLVRYLRNEPLLPCRAAIGHGETPWSLPSFQLPAPRPAWLRGAQAAPDMTTSLAPMATQKIAKESFAPASNPAAAGPPEVPVIVENSSAFTALLDQHASLTIPAASSDWLDGAVLQLRQALTSYNLQAKVLSARLTPNTALVRLQGSDRLQVKDLEARRVQLLTSHGLNLISITPRPLEVVVAIERPERETVSLRNVWKRLPERRSENPNLLLLVGVRELDGEPLYLNLGGPSTHAQAHAPHTLVAGTTGSGKSVLIQNLLLDLGVTNNPDQVKVYVIDPKMGVDYFAVEGLPHFAEPIVTEQPRAVQLLEELAGEMDRRYKAFREARVNKLSDYNAKVDIKDRLPVLFVVHDEFAEWMLTDSYRDVVTSVVSRLSVKARAAGIHLLFAAQRPDNTVMPMQLRDNLGNRLILRVEGEGTSEIALGAKGADRLLGRGHCAARLQGESDIIFAQVPLISTGEVTEVVAAIQCSPKSV